MTRYELLERIGAGGMAEIFRGKAVAAGGFEKPVAIKRILPHLSQDRRFVELLIAEAKILSQLRHRNIVQIFDVGLGDDGQYFLVMEFVDGVDLGAVQRALETRRKRLPLDLALHVGAEVCEALEHAHSATGPDGAPMRLVHRDVSPSNVLVSRAGEVKLTDFGIAKRPEEHTGHGSVRGKFAYISPEQAENRHVDARSDVYSLGVVLFELIAGRRLFSQLPDLDALKAVREGKVPRPRELDPQLPGDVEEVLLAALARDPAARVKSAGELGGRLRAIRYGLAQAAGDPAKELGRVVAGMDARKPDAAPELDRTVRGKKRPVDSGFEVGESTVVRIRTADGFGDADGPAVAILRARQVIDRFEEEETRLGRAAPRRSWEDELTTASNPTVAPPTTGPLARAPAAAPPGGLGARAALAAQAAADDADEETHIMGEPPASMPRSGAASEAGAGAATPRRGPALDSGPAALRPRGKRTTTLPPPRTAARIAAARAAAATGTASELDDGVVRARADSVATTPTAAPAMRSGDAALGAGLAGAVGTVRPDAAGARDEASLGAIGSIARAGAAVVRGDGSIARRGGGGAPGGPASTRGDAATTRGAIGEAASSADAARAAGGAPGNATAADASLARPGAAGAARGGAGAPRADGSLARSDGPLARGGGSTARAAGGAGAAAAGTPSRPEGAPRAPDPEHAAGAGALPALSSAVLASSSADLRASSFFPADPATRRRRWIIGGAIAGGITIIAVLAALLSGNGSATGRGAGGASSTPAGSGPSGAAPTGSGARGSGVGPAAAGSGAGGSGAGLDRTAGSGSSATIAPPTAAGGSSSGTNSGAAAGSSAIGPSSPTSSGSDGAIVVGAPASAPVGAAVTAGSAAPPTSGSATAAHATGSAGAPGTTAAPTTSTAAKNAATRSTATKTATTRTATSKVAATKSTTAKSTTGKTTTKSTTTRSGTRSTTAGTTTKSTTGKTTTKSTTTKSSTKSGTTGAATTKSTTGKTTTKSTTKSTSNGKTPPRSH